MATLTPQQRIQAERNKQAATTQRELLGEGIGGTILERPKKDATPTVDTTIRVGEAPEPPKTAAENLAAQAEAEANPPKTRIEEISDIPPNQRTPEQNRELLNLRAGETVKEEPFTEFKTRESKLKTKTDRIKRQEELRLAQEDADIKKRGEQIESTAGAFTSTFAQGREGVFSAARAGVGEEAGKLRVENLQRLDRTIESADIRAKEIQDQIEEKRLRSKKANVESLQNQLNQVQTQKLNAQAEFIQAQKEATDDALDKFEKVNELPASVLASMGSDALGELAAAAGFDATVGIAIGAKATALAEAEEALAKNPDDIDAQNRVSALRGDIKSIQSSAVGELAKQSQEIAALVADGTIDQATADAIGVKLGLKSEGETPKEKASRLKTEAETRKINLKNTKSVKGGASNGAGNINPTSVIKDFDFGNEQAGSNVTDSEGNVVGRVTSTFGADHSQISGEKEHNGIDVVFNNGEVPSMQTGVVIKKGFSDNTYGGYVWIQDTESGEVLQYGHMSPEAVTGVSLGQSFQAGEIFGSQATNANDWGSSTGAHTDIRLVGAGQPEMSADGEDPLVSSWAYEILDGNSTVSNVQNTEDQPDLRNDVLELVQKRRKEGYRSKYPVLTKTQLGLVNQISDDYNKDKQVGDMLDVKTGFDGVTTVFGSDAKIATATGFDDITAINSFQRMIDPGATVREGDVALLQTSIPFLERVSPTFKWSQFTKGDKLPVDVRKSLLRVANNLYNDKATIFNGSVGERFQARSDASGVPFNLIGQEFTVYNTPIEPTIKEETNGAFDTELSGIDAELAELESLLTNQE